MPRARTPITIRRQSVHPDDRLITPKEAAAKLGLHGESSDATLKRYVDHYPELARAKRWRRCPGERPTPMFLASAVSAFLASAFLDERYDGPSRAENLKGTAPEGEATPAAQEARSA